MEKLCIYKEKQFGRIDTWSFSSSSSKVDKMPESKAKAEDMKYVVALSSLKLLFLRESLFFENSKPNLGKNYFANSLAGNNFSRKKYHYN